MTTNDQTASLSNRAFLLNAPGALPTCHTQRPSTARRMPSADLTLERRRAVQARVWEDMAWLGLAASAFATLALTLV